MRVLAIGDVVGSPGRNAVVELVPKLIKEEGVDFVIANAENAAGGSGVTPKVADELLGCGVDVLTTGDHVWKRKEIEEVIVREPRLLRPANYPGSPPGEGSVIVKSRAGIAVGVICLVGRVFMQSLECPFRSAKEHIEKLRKETPIIAVDIHAEATSEKIALTWYVDGSASFVFGTHTHVPTADERVLPKGTAFISDLGMTGPHESILGRKIECVLKAVVTQMPTRFEVAEKDVRINGVKVVVDSQTGRADSIKRIEIKEGD